MNEVSEGVNDARAEVAAEASDFKPDLCDLILTASASDDYGGSVASETIIATDIPCSYEALGSFERQIADKILVGATHRLQLPSNSTTWTITPAHRLVIHANGDVAEMVCENPTLDPDSYSPFVNLLATVAIQ